MPVSPLEIGQPLGNNKVEVSLYKNTPVEQKYSVPEEKADEFIASYHKAEKKASILSTIAMVGLGCLGAVTCAKLTSKWSMWLRVPATAAGAITGWTLAFTGMAKYGHSMEKDLLNQYGGEKLPRQNVK